MFIPPFYFSPGKSLSLPGYEVVLAAIYLALTQLSDRQGTTKVHMHAAVTLLQDSAGLQQTLQRKKETQNQMTRFLRITNKIKMLLFTATIALQVLQVLCSDL